MTVEMTRRGKLHGLVDVLTDSNVAVAEAFLEFLAVRAAEDDPVLRAFMAAPVRTEPLSQEDLVAIAEGRRDIASGDVVSWDSYLASREAQA